MEIVLIDVGDEVGLELLLRVEVRRAPGSRVEGRAGIDHEHRALRARLIDDLRRPRDVSERVGGAAARADLAAQLGEREHGERRLRSGAGVGALIRRFSLLISSNKPRPATSPEHGQRRRMAGSYSTLTGRKCLGRLPRSSKEDLHGCRAPHVPSGQEEVSVLPHRRRRQARRSRWTLHRAARHVSPDHQGSQARRRAYQKWISGRRAAERHARGCHPPHRSRRPKAA